ncbi:LysR family transcriptional regulator [Candidimonas humi]|uniref:LysR family transcriptional regulator n=1 Tax=Candidimonas humi TaxID=683355 RepID=A0ABV8P118_9BURK|nr:LysR family transcriptional regulator [Candidimonas humi]
MKAFLTVAEIGNVTRAAELLNIVQPAVSRQIRLLEEDLGIQLFERGRHGMALTDAGRALVEYGQRVMLELDRARALLKSSETAVGGLVTIGLLPSTSEMLASPLVTAVSQQYPGIRLRVAMGYAGTLLRWLETGEVDAALLYRAERSAEIQTTPLVEEPLWVIGPRDSGFERSQPVHLSKLVGRKFILPSAPHGIRTLVEHACRTAAVSLDLSVETNALSVQRSLVLGGHGLTILPPIAVAEDLAQGRLSGAPVCGPDIARTIVLALPSNRSTGRHIRSVVNILVEEMRRAVQAGLWPEGRWLAD